MKSLLFVDDEVRVLQGLQRQLRSMRNEWDMSFAEGGRQALELMATKPVDVVVSDMMMPGMDGAQFLTEVSRRHPQTVRIVLSGHAARESVMSLIGPAHLYLSKPCEGEELRRAISRAFALRELLGNDKLKRLATRIQNLPTLPAAQRQLTEELQKEDPSPERVGEIISHDVGMTARMLQLVNSAFFGLPQSMDNPTDAVMYLGLTTVRSLVLSMHIFSQFEAVTWPEFSLDGFMSHSWQVASLARRIAQAERCELKVADQCFLAGLLHDVGRLVMASELKEEYHETLRQARERQVAAWQVEQESFGATHENVGAYLLGLWGLPNVIIEAAGQHHHPEHCDSHAFSPVIAVHAANAFAYQLGAVGRKESPDGYINLDHLTRLGLAERVAGWRDLCAEEAVN